MEYDEDCHGLRVSVPEEGAMVVCRRTTNDSALIEHSILKGRLSALMEIWDW